MLEVHLNTHDDVRKWTEMAYNF